jgi:hypothetical protein
VGDKKFEVALVAEAEYEEDLVIVGNFRPRVRSGTENVTMISAVIGMKPKDCGDSSMTR